MTSIEKIVLPEFGRNLPLGSSPSRKEIRERFVQITSIVDHLKITLITIIELFASLMHYVKMVRISIVDLFLGFFFLILQYEYCEFRNIIFRNTSRPRLSRTYQSIEIYHYSKFTTINSNDKLRAQTRNYRNYLKKSEM